MAPDPLRSATTTDDTAAIGRLGAVLAARGRPGPVALGPHGPHLVTSVADTRRVLTDAEVFRFPVDVTRRATTGEHAMVARLRPDQVARGTRTFEAELARATTAWDDGGSDDAMTVLRLPVARSTTDAVLGPLETTQRDHVADLVLAWVDALAPIIAATRPPRRWSRARREERRTRAALERSLEDLRVEQPTVSAVELAAGVQVPIAAGAWLLVLLAQHPQQAAAARRHGRAAEVAWETLRLRPPTWVTARMTARSVSLEHGTLPAHAVVLVSPLLLGHLPDLLPTGSAEPEVVAAVRGGAARLPGTQPGAGAAHRPGPMGRGSACPADAAGADRPD